MSDPKGVSPSQRVNEFQVEPLTVSHGLSLLFSVLRATQPETKHPHESRRVTEASKV